MNLFQVHVPRRRIPAVLQGPQSVRASDAQIGPGDAGPGAQRGQPVGHPVLRDLGADPLRGQRGLRERHQGSPHRQAPAALLDDQPQEGPETTSPGTNTFYNTPDDISKYYKKNIIY